jgi:anti-sigma factor RsiW
MKEMRFIELLNLYVDQQLSTSDASELETEILRNPRRRRTYQQYCRMQKACTQLFEHERSRAPSSPALSRALAEADRKIVDFPQESASWFRGSYVAGLAAVAACVAIVVVSRNHAVNGPAAVDMAVNAAPAIHQPVAQPPVAVVVAEPVKIPAVSTADVAKTGQKPEFYSVLATRKLVPTREMGSGELVSEESTQERPILDWMRGVNLPPIRKVSADDLAFETRPMLKQEPRIFRGERPVQAQVEKAAFDFQR